MMISVDGQMAMAVLPASYQINFDRLRDAIGSAHISLANEREFSERFPDC